MSNKQNIIINQLHIKHWMRIPKKWFFRSLAKDNEKRLTPLANHIVIYNTP
jgi:hypothetical protein